MAIQQNTGFRMMEGGLEDTPLTMSEDASRTAFDQVTSGISNLYQNMLQRSPDAGGLQYWVDQVNSGKATLNDVSNAFKGSTEFLGTQLRSLNSLWDAEVANQEQPGIQSDIKTGSVDFGGRNWTAFRSPDGGVQISTLNADQSGIGSGQYRADFLDPDTGEVTTRVLDRNKTTDRLGKVLIGTMAALIAAPQLAGSLFGTEAAAGLGADLAAGGLSAESLATLNAIGPGAVSEIIAGTGAELAGLTGATAGATAGGLLSGAGSELAVAGVEGAASQAATSAYTQTLAATGNSALANIAADVASSSVAAGSTVAEAVATGTSVANSTAATGAVTGTGNIVGGGGTIASAGIEGAASQAATAAYTQTLAATGNQQLANIAADVASGNVAAGLSVSDAVAAGTSTALDAAATGAVTGTGAIVGGGGTITGGVSGLSTGATAGGLLTGAGAGTAATTGGTAAGTTTAGTTTGATTAGTAGAGGAAAGTAGAGAATNLFGDNPLGNLLKTIGITNADELKSLFSTGIDMAARNTAASELSKAQTDIGKAYKDAASGVNFTPYGVTTNLFGTSFADGTMKTSLSPDQQTLVDNLLKAASGSAEQAQLTNVDTLAQDYYNKLAALSKPEQERQRLATEERLRSQGRLGVSGSAYGGTSPELLAQEQAIAQQQLKRELQSRQAALDERGTLLSQAQAAFTPLQQLSQQQLAAGQLGATLGQQAANTAYQRGLLTTAGQRAESDIAAEIARLKAGSVQAGSNVGSQLLTNLLTNAFTKIGV